MEFKRLGFFSTLVIATVSGLLIRVVGDPLVKMTNPHLEEFFEDVEDNWDEIEDNWEEVTDWFADRL
jgi:hypothetical protein